VETDGSMYLSDDGLRTVEFDRRLTRAMVQLMTRAEEPAAPVAYRNRGAGVFLTDKILHEAGYSYPRQIADALAAPADEATKNRLWVAHTNVRRAADIEDRYLDKTLEASCSLFASCVGE
jgi:hypothetical protein